MDFKKVNAPTTTVTRDTMELCKDTENIYETVAIISKRANQIAAEIKTDLEKKLQDYASSASDNSLEEVFENREQIEISKYYERMPKPTLIAIEEYKKGEVYFRSADEEMTLKKD
ncbi:MAG: DNA-directed RNA polymerase subunit omega [Bacteroidales bacterium]|nr:DNA-directed RNA polymerase subunit omega [Bacteroidales bacterium]MBQ3555129.1 DNA-directed RNA polymerase subunit omega [Bacteroidales bacterium]MBR2475098.1 DNA-directed RNA polymerase subunit omega [Bacteroidaceae bacterium]MBR3609040.1 DNA-directed RNA polymerase subunit omega [Bacteroidales bacterium]